MVDRVAHHGAACPSLAMAAGVGEYRAAAAQQAPASLGLTRA